MGSGTGGANRGYTLTANITQSTNDPANNRTYCYASIVLNCTNNYFQGWTASGGFYINGSAAAYWSGNYSMPGNNTSITLGNWEGWIGHDTNGNGSLTVSGDFDTASSPSYLPDYVSVSYNEGLPNYDRSPNAPSINYTSRDAAGTGITVVSNAASIKNSGPGITDYNFQYSTDNSSWSADQAMGTDLTGSFTGTSTQTYYVRSRAYNSDGWSGYGSSQIAYGFPTAPQSLGATASGSVSGRINLSWTAPTYTGAGITGYKIYRKLSTDASFPTTPTATTTGTGTTYADDGLSRGLLYDYRIAARNAVSDGPSSQGAYSNTVTSVMAPGVPTAPTLSTVVASTNTFGTVTLNWAKPSNTVGGIVDYYLYADGVLKTSVSGENTLTGSITGLVERQTYAFTIRARNQFAVNNSSTGDLSNSISRKSPGPPTAPTSLTSSAPFFPPGTIDLSWVAPSDVGTEGGVITGYSVYLAGSSTPIKTTTGTGTTTTVEDLIPATSYTFNVKARNAIADIVGTFSVASNSTTATAQGEPNAPTNLTVTSDPVVAGRLILTWTPPVGYNTGFRVYTGDDVLVANISIPRLEIDNLVVNNSYSYKVRARNPLTDLTGSPGGPASTTVSGVVGSTSTQTVPSISVTNNTNSTFVGTYNLVSTTSTTMSYSKTASAIPFASVPVGGGSTVNNTNTNLNGTYTVNAPTTTSITFAKAGSDIAANTSTPSGTMYNNTNVIFNGSFEVLASPAPDPIAKTLSYTKVSSTISSRAASGTVTNNSNAIYNGEYTVTGITENTINYSRTNVNIAESNAFGTVYNKTNTDIFNGTFTVVDTPDHKTVQYSTGDLVYGENLVPNPSFETVSTGTTTLRTNIAVNPSFETNVTNWATSSSSLARSTTRYHSGAYSGLVTPGSTSGSISITPTTTSGRTYQFAVWVYSEEATTLRLTVSTPSTVGTTESIPADTWTRISLSFIAGATSPACAIETVGSTQPFYVDDVLIEDAAELRPFFDGATTDALGWDYGWSGTAHASTSTAKALSASGAPTPAGYTQVSSAVTSSYAKSHSGNLSAYVVPSSNVGGVSKAITTVASTVYTFSAWVFTTVAKNMVVATDATVGPVTLVPANTWTRLSVAYTADDTSTTVVVRGTDSTQAFYVDDIMLQASASLQTYFDGDTDATTTTWPTIYSWSGTPHDSISLREVGGTLPSSGAELLAPYGVAARVDSEASLQIQYRSGWLG